MSELLNSVVWGGCWKRDFVAKRICNKRAVRSFKQKSQYNKISNINLVADFKPFNCLGRQDTVKKSKISCVRPLAFFFNLLYSIKTRGDGGIGRHVRLRSLWRKLCRFKSCSPQKRLLNFSVVFFFSKNHFFPKVTFYPSDILNITATGG